MSAQYTVSGSSEAQEAGGVAAVVASLPATFGPASPEVEVPLADVCVIEGEPGWTTRAGEALGLGARAVMIVNPVPEALGQLAALADATHAAVVLDLRWGSNPALETGKGPGAQDAVRNALATAAMLDSVATAAPGSDPARLLGEHLAALLAVTGPIGGVHVLRSDAFGYTASGRLANGSPFTVQGILTAARPAGVDIRIYTTSGGVTICIPDPSAAWPAEVRVTGQQGELLLPTLYESAHRAAWRRLKEHLSAGTLPNDLADFALLTDLYTTQTHT